MAENELDGIFDSLPQGFAVCMGIDDKATRALEQIAQKVAKYVEGRLVAWKGAEPHSVHVEFHRLGPQTKLESVRRVDGLNIRDLRCDIQFCFDPAIVFCLGDNRRVVCLCTSTHDVSLPVVIEYGWDLAIPHNVLLARKSALGDGQRGRRGRGGHTE